MDAGCAAADDAVGGVFSAVELVWFELAGGKSLARKTNGASTSTCTSLGFAGGSAEAPAEVVTGAD